MSLREERPDPAQAVVPGTVEEGDAAADSGMPAGPTTRAIADGPKDPIDNGGFPILPLVGAGVATIAVVAGAWQLLRRRSARR